MLNPISHRRLLKKGMPGEARVVERGTMDRGGTSFNLPMTLQVHVEGIAPYEVEDQWMVKQENTITLDLPLPVRVDPDDHQRVAIDWDGAQERYQQQRQARKDSLASGSGVTVSFTQAPAPPPPVQDDGEDRIALLERLVKLREMGALTDEEFAEEKRRILDG